MGRKNAGSAYQPTHAPAGPALEPVRFDPGISAAPQPRKSCWRRRVAGRQIPLHDLDRADRHAAGPPHRGVSRQWGSPSPVLRPRSPQQPSAFSQPRPRRKALRHVGHALAYLAIVLLSLDLAAEAYFIGLNWVNPPVTAYMLEGAGEHLHDYVSLRYVSPYMIA